MPKFTNRTGLPSPLVKALSIDTYSKGRADISVTGLMSSPRMHLLKEHHADEIEIDVVDRLWAMFGTAVHAIIEKGSEGDDSLAEERIFTEIDGWIISGGIDLQKLGVGKAKLTDWKTCSAYAVMNGKPDWETQLNCYAWLVEREKGIVVSGLEIGAIIKDWSSGEAKRNPDYPQSPIQMIPVRIWHRARRDEYISERLRLHQDVKRAHEWGEELPECTPEEMWERPSKWAVFKKDGKRALKVFDTEAEAAELLVTTPGGHIEHRPGRRVRCEDWCEVAPFCSQWKAYKDSTPEKE